MLSSGITAYSFRPLLCQGRRARVIQAGNICINTVHSRTFLFRNPQPNDLLVIMKLGYLNITLIVLCSNSRVGMLFHRSPPFWFSVGVLVQQRLFIYLCPPVDVGSQDHTLLEAGWQAGRGPLPLQASSGAWSLRFSWPAEASFPSSSWGRVAWPAAAVLSPGCTHTEFVRGRRLLRCLTPVPTWATGTCRWFPKPKFLCLRHSEARQTETQQFGAEKGSLQGHTWRMGGLCPHKTPNSWKCFSKAILKAM